jgi:hypothetical protein
VHHKLRAQHMTLQRILQVRPDRRLALSRASAPQTNARCARASQDNQDAAGGGEGRAAPT